MKVLSIKNAKKINGNKFGRLIFVIKLFFFIKIKENIINKTRCAFTTPLETINITGKA